MPGESLVRAKATDNLSCVQCIVEAEFVVSLHLLVYLVLFLSSTSVANDDKFPWHVQTFSHILSDSHREDIDANPGQACS